MARLELRDAEAELAPLVAVMQLGDRSCDRDAFLGAIGLRERPRQILSPVENRRLERRRALDRRDRGAPAMEAGERAPTQQMELAVARMLRDQAIDELECFGV